MIKNLYNASVDVHNIETYRLNGPVRDKAALYNCVLCEKVCSLNNSISDKGSRLICDRCANTKFPNLLRAFKWVEGWDRVLEGWDGKTRLRGGYEEDEV